MTQHHETVKNITDVASAFAAFGAFLDLFSPVFGLIGAIWTLMRIAEMWTGKSFSEIIGKKKKDDENG
jgi:L-lactate permease